MNPIQLLGNRSRFEAGDDDITGSAESQAYATPEKGSSITIRETLKRAFGWREFRLSSWREMALLACEFELVAPRICTGSGQAARQSLGHRGAPDARCTRRV
jgi:hypothetical protein